MNHRRITPRLRIQFLGLLMLMGMGALGLRLWWIQVAHGTEWTAQIRGSSQATVRIPSVRGEIKDRNGLALVQNRASYEVDFYLPEMIKGYRERFGSPPLTEYRAIISGMPKDLKEPDIIKVVNDGIIPRLDDLDIARDYNAGQLQRHYRNDTEVPFSYIKDIDMAPSPRTSSVMSARRTTSIERKQRNLHFIRVMWKENRTSRSRWTNIFAANPACVICGAMRKA